MNEDVKLVVVDEFNGKYFINEAYRPIAEALKAKFEELRYVPVKSILFIENLEDKRKKNNKIILAQVGKIPGKWHELIYQLTGRNFDFIIEIFKDNTQEMSREQIVALLYHEMRHIQFIPESYKVDIVSHDIEDWSNMIEKLGVNWAGTKAYIPDLLDADVDWDSIEGPATLFPEETTLRVVK